jgi:hypothetical protein
MSDEQDDIDDLRFEASLPQWAMDAIGEGMFPSPEAVADLARQRIAAQDLANGALLFAVAIDQLHTRYIFMRMVDRQPSDADKPIIDGYEIAARHVRSVEPAALQAQIRRVTWLLRSMATAAEREGHPDLHFRMGLAGLAHLAPDVKVSDIPWF